MRPLKFLAAGLLAMSLAACHTEGHQFCDWDDDGETDTGCVLLVKAVGVTAAAVAIHHTQLSPEPF